MTAPSTCDFDLAGIVRIRVSAPTPEDVAVVRRQLGLPPTTLQVRPDITIRFVDRLPSTPVTYVGVSDTGYSDDHFVTLRGRGGVRVRASVPFDAIGRDDLVITCERGTPAVPHLLAIVNLICLSKGVLPLHASAFHLDGTDVLVTGWAKSGKTEALLAAAARGAHYIADEWVYLEADGTMHGVPEPIRLWAWHLAQLPEVRASRSRADLGRLAAWQSLSRLARAGANVPLVGPGLAAKAHPVLARQAYLQVPPRQLFPTAPVGRPGRLDAVVLMMSWESSSITAEPTEGREVSARMAASLEDERAALAAHYRQFRYAFPDRRNELIEQAPAMEARLLAALFDGRPAAKVCHPYPCNLTELGGAVVSAAGATRAARAEQAGSER
jgi:hypothetical protein